MWTAKRWRSFYAAERESLGPRGLGAMFDAAPELDLPAAGALVFPHARLTGCGPLVAAVARAVVRSGCERVLAIGVLHGGREEDADAVRAARGGDARAAAALRGVHGPGAAGDRGVADEEFSLDNFAALLDVAAAREGRAPPRVVARYPFLVGAEPRDLPGIDELYEVLAGGAAVVATGDLVHHGAGYATPEPSRIGTRAPSARATARAWIDAGLGALARGDLPAFFANATDVRSDFRDAGPALAALLASRGEPLRAFVLTLELVSYADVLGAPEPTWVAAALAAVTRARAADPP